MKSVIIKNVCRFLLILLAIRLFCSCQAGKSVQSETYECAETYAIRSVGGTEVLSDSLMSHFSLEFDTLEISLPQSMTPEEEKRENRVNVKVVNGSLRGQKNLTHKREAQLMVRDTVAHSERSLERNEETDSGRGAGGNASVWWKFLPALIIMAVAIRLVVRHKRLHL